MSLRWWEEVEESVQTLLEFPVDDDIWTVGLDHVARCGLADDVAEVSAQEHCRVAREVRSAGVVFAAA